MTQVSFLSLLLIEYQERTKFVSTCATKWKAPIACMREKSYAIQQILLDIYIYMICTRKLKNKDFASMHTAINCFRNVHASYYVPKNHHIVESNYGINEVSQSLFQEET